MITLANIKVAVAGLDMDGPSLPLAQVATSLLACRAVADAEATEAIDALVGRINGRLQARAKRQAWSKG